MLGSQGLVYTTHVTHDLILHATTILQWEDAYEGYERILASFDEAISSVDYVEKHTYTDEERRKVIQEMAESCEQ